MKLDVNVLRYLSKDDFRVLTAVEMGQKNVRGALHAATALSSKGDSTHGAQVLLSAAPRQALLLTLSPAEHSMEQHAAADACMHACTTHAATAGAHTPIGPCLFIWVSGVRTCLPAAFTINILQNKYRVLRLLCL